MWHALRDGVPYGLGIRTRLGKGRDRDALGIDTKRFAQALGVILLASSFLQPALAHGEEASTLCAKWQAPIDLDSKAYVDVGSLPPSLQGEWVVVAESKDGGATVISREDPKPLMRTTGTGWSSSESPASTPETPFLKICRSDQDPEAARWFIARDQKNPLLLVHVPKEPGCVLVRELAFEGAGGNVRESRRYVAKLMQENAQAAAVAEGVRGKLPFFSLKPWVPEDLDRMRDRFEKNKWPKYVPENEPGILVTEVLPDTCNGIKPNDMIYSIDGKLVTSKEKFEAVPGTMAAGQPFTVKLKRVQPNSKGVPTWMVVQGGGGKTVNNADIVAHQQKAKAQALARQEEEKRKKEKEARKDAEARARIYVFRNGRTLTGAEIEVHNKKVEREGAADVVGEGVNQQMLFAEAVKAIAPMMNFVSKGDAAGLRHYMTNEFNRRPDVAGEAKRILTLSPYSRSIRTRDDGTALFWFEVWEEAASALLPP